MSGLKDTNPKEAFGDAKVPLGLVPESAIIEMAMGMLEGTLKYGGHNYRVKGVKASTYNDAMERHRMKWWNGQDRDPITKVRELASIMCCCAILIDAEICGVLTDNRPPRAPVGAQLDENMKLVAHLKDLFKDHNPIQYTQAWVDDTRRASESSGGQDAEGVQGVLPKARVKRNGRTGRGLSRKPSRLRVSHRSKGAR